MFSGTRAVTVLKSVEMSERRAAETLLFGQCISVRLPERFWKIADDGMDRQAWSRIPLPVLERTRCLTD